MLFRSPPSLCQGNYVVQYVLDLNDNRFIEAIVRQFLGNVSALSAQKFSSNVVEKCIRVADASGRRAIIDELLNKQRLERLLRDSCVLVFLLLTSKGGS